MDTRRILAELRAERNRLDQAITAIEAISSDGAVSRPARQINPSSAAKPQRRRRRLTAAGRKRLSDMMKQRWAERRKKLKSA
jgi:hypothetical protein